MLTEPTSSSNQLIQVRIVIKKKEELVSVLLKMWFLCDSPCTTRRPTAVRLILVPGRLAAQTYTPEC